MEGSRVFLQRLGDRPRTDHIGALALEKCSSGPPAAMGIPSRSCSLQTCSNILTASSSSPWLSHLSQSLEMLLGSTLGCCHSICHWVLPSEGQHGLMVSRISTWAMTRSKQACQALITALLRVSKPTRAVVPAKAEP